MIRSFTVAAAVATFAVACAAWADEVRPKDARGAGAPEMQFKVKKRASLKPRWTQPAFYHSSPLLPVDRGRLLYIARGAGRSPELVYVLDLGSLEERTLRAPTPAYVAEHPELSLNPVVEDLLCYDRADGRAGLLVKDTAQRGAYFLWWDLAEDRISKAIQLDEKGPTTRWIAVRPLGYDPARKECIVHVERNDGDMPGVSKAGGPYRESIHAVGVESAREIATFTASFMTSHGPYHDAAHRRAVVTEITEISDARPRGYLVDLANGGVRPFDIPQLVYGFTFSPDGRTLYAYGVTARELWAINAATGAATRRVRIGDIGHALGWLGNMLVVVGNVRLHLLDQATLGHRAQVATRKVLPGLLNAEGSLVLGRTGTVAVKDFYSLTVAKLEW